jgi:hypothetical protein
MKRLFVILALLLAATGMFGVSNVDHLGNGDLPAPSPTPTPSSDGFEWD